LSALSGGIAHAEIAEIAEIAGVVDATGATAVHAIDEFWPVRRQPKRGSLRYLKHPYELANAPLQLSSGASVPQTSNSNPPNPII